MIPGRFSRPLACLVLVALTAAAYSGSFDGRFVSDDRAGIRDNAAIHVLDWPHVVALFGRFQFSNYLPVTTLSLAVDYALWGENPAGYHATNLLIHLLCALCVLSILCRLGFSTPVATAVSLLWALHPLQVESVAWISERKNLLSGLFFFAAFRVWLAFSDEPRPGRYAALLALFVLAALSKMNTVVLPAVVLAFERCWRFRLRRWDFDTTLPLFVVALCVVVFNLLYSPLHGREWHGDSPITTWLTASGVPFRYLAKMVWPVDLRPWYPIPLRDSLLDPVVIASLLGLVALVGVFVWGLRRRRREAFWLAWFLVTLAPMLNIVPFRSLMQDRYMYLPLLGPLAAAGMLTEGFVRRRPWLALALLLPLVAACMALTLEQVEVWSSNRSYWRRVGVPEENLPWD